jgi:ABC-type polar amino acid transport system ATPase subunit
MSISVAETGRAKRSKQDKDVVLNVHRIRKAFGAFTALDDVTVQVHETEVVAVIGPSGSGKSTLVRCVDQLEVIDGGSIVLDGDLLGYSHVRGQLRALPERQTAQQRKRMGMVFQSFNLFPHMTVLANITEPQIRAHGIKRGAAEERARHLLDRVGLSHRASAYPITLSGGEQQRVAIARALAPHPRIMLFDEPTSALDPELVDEVMAVIRDLAAVGRTMMVVTHDMAFARYVADWCIFMEHGHIVEEGAPDDLFSRPSSDRLKAFLSRESGDRQPAEDTPSSVD